MTDYNEQCLGHADLPSFTDQLRSRRDGIAECKFRSRDINEIRL